MVSLKDTAKKCLGITPTFSVIQDFYGFPFGHPGRDMSLKEQLQLIQGPALNFNLIRVGLENFSLGDHQEIQTAVQVTRELYAKVGLGVRRLVWAFISVADAGDHTTIDSVAEAKDLTDDWNGPAGAHDVFIVRNMLTSEGFIGYSAIKGECGDKDDKDELTGSVASLNGTGPFSSGVLMGHEVGHYLGLKHTNAANNVMQPSVSSSNTTITSSQGAKIRDHCWVSDVC
jgi:matrixin